MTMPRTRGWRSARWRDGVAAATPQLAGAAVAMDSPVAVSVPGDAAEPKWPWQNVRWTIAYLGFLYYVFVIITYHAPNADWGMLVALGALFLQKERITLPPSMILMGAFLAIAVLGYAATDYKTDVYDGLIRLGKLWLIAFAAFNVLHTRQQVRFFIVFFLACYAMYPIRGTYINIANGIMESNRVAWNFIFSNPNDLSAYTFLPLGMAAGLVIVERNKLIRLALAAGLVLMPLMMFFTQSRGSLVALMVSALIAVLLQRKRLKYLAMIGGFGLIAFIFAPSEVWQRVGGLKNVSIDASSLADVDPEGSATQRYMIWQVALTMTSEHPALGVGFGAYKDAHWDNARTHGAPGFAWGHRDTHNTYLNVLAETGVLGLPTFLGIFVAAVIYANRVRRRVRRALPRQERQIFLFELGLLAYAVAAIFGTYVEIPFTYLFAATLFSLARVTEREFDALPAAAPARR